MAGQHRTRTPWIKVGVAGVAVAGAFLLVNGGEAASAKTGVHASASAPASAPSSQAARPVHVTLREKNGSGISGEATVTGSRVVATAEGMDASRVYVSYVYGAGSSSSGNNPCVLTGERAAGPVDTVGRWTVDADGHGTLVGSIALSQLDAGTMSIRRNDTGTKGLAGPTPADPLMSCGAVGPRKTTALGQVQDQLPPVKLPATPSVVPTR